MSELTGGARPPRDAGRERPHPTDWQRIETEKTDRDAARRNWDQRHDPSEEFEKAARLLPDDYGSHRPKHPDLTPEQVAEIEEFTGRSIDQVLAARERDPRAGHNRAGQETGTQEVGALDSDADRAAEPDVDNADGPERRDEDSRATITFGNEETAPQVEDDPDGGESTRHPGEKRSMGPASDAARDTAQVQRADRSEDREDQDQQAAPSLIRQERVIDLGEGLRFRDYDPLSCSGESPDGAGQAGATRQDVEAGGWVPQQAEYAEAGRSWSERPWWAQDRPSVDPPEKSGTAQRESDETGEPGERLGEPQHGTDRVVIEIDTDSPAELHRSFVLDRLTSLANKNQVEIYKETSDPGEQRYTELEYTEFRGEDARSTVAQQRMREAGLAMSGARYDLDPAVKGAVEMYLNGADNRIMISPRWSTGDDDHRFPSFVSAMEAAAPEGAKIKLYTGVHGQSIVITGQGKHERGER